ncbi:MAG: WbqC family protein [Bacteroidia bacterium]|nr:WbqC family protein [Bacteroidia bacterium]
MLLSLAYLPPISYFRAIASNTELILEQHENYTRQTYRNRCKIYGANGMIVLNIPVKKNGKEKIQIRDVKIDYSTNWQHIHAGSIESAYRHSPYYEYYADDISRFYEGRPEYLFDFNMKLLMKLLEILEITSTIKYTDTYQKSEKGNLSDLRDLIHPKKDFRAYDPALTEMQYVQVFSDKHGFIPDLSIIDLLFNLGPDCGDILL